MRCIYCGSRTIVVDKRNVDSYVRRRRQCLKCGRRFTTYERPSEEGFVIKRDGRVEKFSREKLIRGIMKACEKRPITAEEIEEFAKKIEARVMARGRVGSRTIGRWVLNFLKRKDKVAYVRFASVYKSPEDVEDLEKIIKEVVGDAGESDKA